MSLCWPLQMPPTQKAVLISLADNANDDGFCWPSIPTICTRTCFSERAVHGAIKWLEDHGALRTNKTNGRHTTYTVTPESYSQPPQEMHHRSKCATAGEAGNPRSKCGTPPQEMQEPPQEMRSNRKEPSKNRKGTVNYDAMSDLEGRGVETKTAIDWLALRKRKKAEVTETAIDGFEREAGKAGMSLDDALKYCCTNGYQGFNASWIKKPPISDNGSKLGKAGQATAANAKKWLEAEDAKH